jgi:hypothetical protein
MFGGHITCIHTGALRILHDRGERPHLFDREVDLTTPAHQRQNAYFVDGVNVTDLEEGRVTVNLLYNFVREMQNPPWRGAGEPRDDHFALRR